MANIDSVDSQKTTSSASTTLRDAHETVLKIFSGKTSRNLVFHNYSQTVRLLNTIKLIMENAQIDNEQVKITTHLSALFCFTGYSKNYKQAHRYSLSFAENFCNSNKVEESVKKNILECISIYFKKNQADHLPGKIFNDAIVALYAEKDANNQFDLLNLEEELMLNQFVSQDEDFKRRLTTLLNSKFLIHESINLFQSQYNKNLIRVKKRMTSFQEEISEDIAVTNHDLYGGIEGVPQRAIQTFFRSNFRVHINLSAIADNKANIMISVNAILISILISFLSYGNITETNPSILFPVVIFIVTGLASLTLAILSARPKITRLNGKDLNPENYKRNIAFFGNFVSLNLNQYEEAMDAMFKDGKLMYGNMVRDMYFLGKVLDKKYWYLSISYNIFMVGFVITVLSFLILLLAK